MSELSDAANAGGTPEIPSQIVHDVDPIAHLTRGVLERHVGRAALRFIEVARQVPLAESESSTWKGLGGFMIDNHFTSNDETVSEDPLAVLTKRSRAVTP